MPQCQITIFHHTFYEVNINPDYIISLKKIIILLIIYNNIIVRINICMTYNKFKHAADKTKLHQTHFNIIVRTDSFCKIF